MPVPYVGQLAALGTAFCWTGSALLFNAAGRHIGSLSVNFIRLAVAFVLFSLYGQIFRGHALPTDAPPESWVWLLASGYVGFFLGDLCLFRSYLLIGPRMSTLLMALAPLIATVTELWLIGQTLKPMQWVGMGCTLAGVTWVVLERPRDRTGIERPHSPLGLLLAGLGAAGQGIGLVLGRRGMGQYDAAASAQIRAIAGIIGFVVLLGLLRWFPKVWAALRQPKAMALTVSGAMVGPTVGVALLLFSVQYIPSGVAQTIVSLVPVLIIPAVIVLHKEPVSFRSIVGALVAVAGVAMLFL